HIERRFHNGHPSSNVYHLHCSQAGGGKLPPPPGTPPPPLPAPCRDGGGPVPPITTTTKPKEEEPSPQQRGHRVSDSLALPAGIPSAHRTKAQALLSSLPAAQQQLVADEWSARLRRGSMHKPLAYLTTLVKRAAAGTFVPELADEERLRREAQQGGAIQAAVPPRSERASQVQQLVADTVAHLRRN
ncbi:MAG: hypothetical protein M0P42_16325, partial [Gallionella sp.]|nr:hypothetical protein [Gallionella sp.]